MGVSTDAMIVYGIPIDEEDIERIRETIPEDDGYEWYDFIDNAYNSDSGLGFISHCSSDYPMYFVGYQILRASRGYPEKIKDDTGNDFKIRDKDIEEFCNKYNLPYVEPGYYLASDWG